LQSGRSGGLRRLGQFLIAMKEASILTDGRAPTGRKIGKHTPIDSLTLKKLGIDKKESREWQKLARMSESEFEAGFATANLARGGATGVPIPKGEKRVLPLSAIRVDERAQPRVKLEDDRVAEYAEDMRCDCKFPAPRCVRGLRRGVLAGRWVSSARSGGAGGAARGCRATHAPRRRAFWGPS